MANRPFRLLAVLAVGIAAGFGGSLAAQERAASPDVLGALVVELRGLRMVMEQMVSAGPRIDLALGRLQLQEQRVNNLLRRHAEVRERLAAAETGASIVARELEERQELLTRASLTEEDRKGFEYEVRKLKERHGHANVEVQRLRAEEADIAQLLSLEQSRWTDINTRLEELERALTRR